ncbi:MAG: transaldolase [Gemmatimonadota bacterium]
MGNPLLDLHALGQSVWYDNISRGLITGGQLRRLIAEDGVRGMTSNPAIFGKAISGADDYTGALRQLAAGGRSPLEIYEAIAIQDIQWAADVLLPVYEASAGADGFVSLEVSPHLANDTEGTVAEALRLAGEVGRRNLMIKVPGTPAGVPAVERLIAAGINVNVTLLFSQANYAAVAAGYLAGLEQRVAAKGDPAAVASVASFFVSRIDSLVDKQIEARLGQIKGAAQRVALRALLGQVAVANAKLAYVHYQKVIGSPRWRKLAARGARPQRLLWASTGTKNPAYGDVLYIEELIGPDTVNTMPGATLEAFRDHGRVRPSLQEKVDEAADTMAALEELGVSMEAATERLQADAVRLFVEPFDQLLAAIESRGRPAPQRRAAPKRRAARSRG